MPEFLESIMADYKEVQSHAVKLVRLTNNDVFGFVDEIRLGFALKTLIENALNHTPSGTQVWMGLRDTNKDEYQILVGDTGQGMENEVLKGIFKPYKKQAGSSGHGLGAALAKVVIESHGGSIKAESEAGMGTKFSIMMPKTPKAPKNSPEN